jgi:nucleotide-binding universal stress UspA family protein
MLEVPDPCRIVAMTADQERECIVVATDASRSAKQAVVTAAELATARDAEFVVVHVLPATEYRVARFGPPLPIGSTLPRSLRGPGAARRPADGLPSRIRLHATAA